MTDDSNRGDYWKHAYERAEGIRRELENRFEAETGALQAKNRDLRNLAEFLKGELAEKSRQSEVRKREYRDSCVQMREQLEDLHAVAAHELSAFLEQADVLEARLGDEVSSLEWQKLRGCFSRLMDACLALEVKENDYSRPPF